MRINKKLIPIKIHYFLRFAASASLSLFLPLIVNQKGVPPQGIGFLWTVLPFLALFTNSASGSVADAFKIHRAVFLFGLVLLTVGSCSVYFLPSLKQQATTPTSLIPKLSKEESQFSKIESENDNQTFINKPQVDLSNVSAVFADNVLEQGRGSYSQSTLVFPFSDILKTHTFWLVFVCLLMQVVGLNISVIFSDTVCFKILGSEHDQYGRQRMWGTIGMGTFSLVIGALVDWYSEWFHQQDFLPAFVICMVLMILDIALVSRMNIPSTSKENFDFGTLKELLKSPLMIIFLLMIFVHGLSIGVNWAFRLIMVEDVAREYDPNFQSMKLLLGILMAVENFGELPFLFLSGHIINRLGHEPVFVLCLLSLWFRYSLYFLLANPWLFLIVEFLHGPSYGLFDANIVFYGTSIAPSGALATMQAIIRASFVAGQSAGSLTGGIFYQRKGGKYTFLWTSLIVLGFTVVYVIFHLIYRLLRNNKKETSSKKNVVKINEK